MWLECKDLEGRKSTDQQLVEIMHITKVMIIVQD